MSFRKIYFLLVCIIAYNTSFGQIVPPGNNPGDVGYVTFNYLGSPVTYTIVRAKDGKVWLQQNLGATRVATSSTDQGGYGDYFQWGRWDDGHQASGSATQLASTLSPNNPTGLGAGNANFIRSASSIPWWQGSSTNTTWSGTTASATNGIDPCTAIGAGWHVPDTAEWQALLKAENITNAATAFSSNVKLPLAGSRTEFGTSLIVVGTQGAYWSSNPKAYDCWELFLDQGNASKAFTALRSYGESIRCLGGTCQPAATQPGTMEGNATVCPGSTNMYSVPPVAGATSYTWTLPNGWTGSSTTNTITTVAGNATGTIIVTATNACGAGPGRAFLVTVHTIVPAVITINGFLLGTASSYTSYQWYKNGTSIQGATGATYTVTANGTYKAVVTDTNGCSDTTNSYTVTNYTGIAQTNAIANAIKIYPNPTINVVYIDAPVAINVSVYAVDGKVVMEQRNAKNLDISKFPAGIYTLQLKDADGNYIRTEKLVKQSW